MSGDVLEESRSEVIVLGADLSRGEPIRGAKRANTWPPLLDRTAPPDGQTPFSGSKRWLKCQFRPEVTLIVQDGAARILDTRNGFFFALEPIGTRMLLNALERGSESMIREVARDHQVSEDVVRHDWEALVREFEETSLAVSTRKRQQCQNRPGVITIWIQLTLAWFSFHLLGWETTVRLWRRLSGSRSVLPFADQAAAAGEVDELVQRIASRHPLNPQCKERALVCWFALRGMGLHARLVMGVMLYPFTAHAWSECGGRVVSDDPERCKQFVPVAIYI